MQVQDHSPEPEKHRRMKTVPKYPSLLAVLGIDEESTNQEPAIDAEVQDLMTAMLTNTSGWEGFGRGL